MRKVTSLFSVSTSLIILNAPCSNAYSEDYYEPNSSSSDGIYQAEFTVESDKRKLSAGENKSNYLAAKFYFNEVDSRSHPYAEAAFLERTSSFTLSYFKQERSDTTDEIDEKGGYFLFNYIPQDSNIIYEGIFGESNGDFNDDSLAEYDVNTKGIGIGIYLNNHSSIKLNYIDDRTKYHISDTSKFTTKDRGASLEYKLVKELSTNQSYNFVVNVDSFEYSYFTVPDDFSTPENEAQTATATVNSVEISGDYYFTQSFSLGGMFKIYKSDDAFDEGKTGGLNFNVFLTPSFSVYGLFSRYQSDNFPDDKNDLYTLGMNIRYTRNRRQFSRTKKNTNHEAQPVFISVLFTSVLLTSRLSPDQVVKRKTA